MPSVNSSSRPIVLASSTVMTPSLPTLSNASAISSPTAGSWAEMLATLAMSSLPSTSRAASSSAALTASTALSMPRLSPIGPAPDATLRRPSRTIAWASTVAVVGLGGDLLGELRAEVLVGVLELHLTGDRDAVVGDRGGTPLLVDDDVAAARAERHLHRVGELVDAALEGLAGRVVELEGLHHGDSRPCLKRAYLKRACVKRARVKRVCGTKRGLRTTTPRHRQRRPPGR